MFYVIESDDWIGDPELARMKLNFAKAWVRIMRRKGGWDNECEEMEGYIRQLMEAVSDVGKWERIWYDISPKIIDLVFRSLIKCYLGEKEATL